MLKALFTAYFKLTGWTFVNKVPDEVRSFVFVGAPHTSNYDIIPTMAVSFLMKRHARFVIKKEWLKFPSNLFLIPMGAYGLDRSQLKGSVTNKTEVMAQLFKEADDFVLMIAAEGTRKPVKEWKTGFYYIAQKAQVPIVLGYADYAKKEAGMGLVLYPTNFEDDMRTIMNFFRKIHGAKPENFELDHRFS